MADPFDQNRGTPTELLAAGRQLALKKDVWSDLSVEQIVQKILDLFGFDIPNWQDIVANFDDLRRAFQGTYTGSDAALSSIQAIVSALRGGLTGLIDMARIPQLSLAQLTNQPSPNLLSGFGDFASEDPMDGGGDWTWDAAVGGGSARATLSGARKVLTSELVPVSAGQVLAVAGKARRQSAVGSGQVARLVVMPVIGDTSQPEVVIGGVGSGTDMSGTVVSQSWTVPADVTGVRVQITVEDAGTSGTVWWDDVTLRKTATSLPQQWIGGLVDALGDLGDDIGDALAKLKEFIEKLTGQARSSVQDAINDAVTFANQVKTLLTGGTVSSPLPNLVGAINLGQNQITGLVGSLAEKATTTMVGSVQNFILNLANAILSAIRKVPVAGGVVADRIQEVLDEMSGLKGQTDSTQAITQSTTTQVAYVQQVIAMQSGMGYWETGPDRTGTPSFAYGLLKSTTHNHTASATTTIPTDGGKHSHSGVLSGSTGGASTGTAHTHPLSSGNVSIGTGGPHGHTATTSVDIRYSEDNSRLEITSTLARWGTVIFKSAAPRRTITWIASVSGSVTGFYVDLYRLNEDGSSTWVYTSPNKAGDLSSAAAWMRDVMPDPFQADMGDMFDVQFRMSGSGTVYISGIEMPSPNTDAVSAFRPLQPGAWRNPSTTPAPASLSTSERDAMYTAQVPFVVLGIDVSIAAAQKRYIFDDFNRSDLGLLWTPRVGNPKVSGNRLTNGSPWGSGNQNAVLINAQPLSTDIIEVKFDLADAGNRSGAGFFCNDTLRSGVWVMSDSSTCVLATGDWDSPSVLASASGGSGSYRIAVSEDDPTGAPGVLTYRVFKDGESTARIIWTDSGSLVVHGKARRWLALKVQSNAFGSAPKIDNFSAADV